jgi:hypothetical protein
VGIPRPRRFSEAERSIDLKRTTNSTGNIREREWHGPDGIQHVRTTKEPHQAIPTFAETIALLMRVRRLVVLVVVIQAYPRSLRTSTQTST